MKAVFLFLNLLGGLGVFLLGIKMMSDGLQKAAGTKLRSIISKATTNRFAATLSGIVATSIIQSSSATTVMVVGFTSAGLLTLSQALGVIFGANIGTTTTAWFISLLGFKVNITMFALPMIGLGFFSQFIQKWSFIRRIGEAMLGFGLLFLGLDLIKNSIPDIQNSSAVLVWITKFRPDTLLRLLGVVGVGTILTIILQSSSAVMALTITCAAKGLIDYPTAAALVLGENIGTTITANIAAIGASKMAKRAALGHLLFNLIGVSWAIIFFNQLLKIVAFIIPGTTEGLAPEVLLTSIPYHLAAFHTVFNLINTCVMLIFIKQFEKLIMFIMPLKKNEEEHGDLVYLKAGITSTPELSIEAASKEADRMAEIVEVILSKLMHAIKAPSSKLFARTLQEVHINERNSDILEYKINTFLQNLTHEQLSRTMISEVLRIFDLTGYLEKMADHGDTIAKLLEKAKANNAFSAQDLENLELICSDTKHIVRQARQTILAEGLNKVVVMKKALEREVKLNELRHNLRDQKGLRDYNARQNTSPLSLTLYSDILTGFEKIGDYALNIIETTLGIREEKFLSLLNSVTPTQRKQNGRTEQQSK